MRPAWLVLVALVTTADATPKKWDYADFWTIAGVTFTDTADTVIQKWGKPQKDRLGGGRTLSYEDGSITFRGDHAIQLDYSAYSKAARDRLAAFDPKFALIGMTCAEAAKHLAFATKVTRYTTCKHYDANRWLVDVTVMCHDTVDAMTIVWYPLGDDVDPDHLPASHCNE